MLFIVEHFDVCSKKAASVVPRYHNRLELSVACFPHKENRLQTIPGDGSTTLAAFLVDRPEMRNQ